MESKALTPTHIIALAVIGGGLCAGLLSSADLGLNMLLLTLYGVFALTWIKHRQGQTLSPFYAFQMGLMLFFSLTLLWHDSVVLHALSLLGLLALAVVAMIMRRKNQPWRLGCIEFLHRHLAGLGYILQQSHRATQAAGSLKGQLTMAKSLARGLLIGLPIVFVFASLLSLSDRRFSLAWSNTMRWDMADLGQLLIYFVAGLMLCLAAFRRPQTGEYANFPDLLPKRTFAHMEVMLVLIMVNVLFASYVAIQFSYFFGGDELIQLQKGLTYAQYARKGFFELVLLAMLVIPMLLVLHWFEWKRDLSPEQASDENNVHWTFFLALSTMVFLMLLIEASAIYRMVLYTHSYGLTELRLYTSVFMLWLIGLLVALPILLMRQRMAYVPVAILYAVCLVALLNVINPERFIVQYNASAGKTDLHYAVTYLSADAIPAVLTQLSDHPLRCNTLHQLQRKTSMQDWRAWNAARANASHLIQQKRQAWNCSL